MAWCQLLNIFWWTTWQIPLYRWTHVVPFHDTVDHKTIRDTMRWFIVIWWLFHEPLIGAHHIDNQTSQICILLLSMYRTFLCIHVSLCINNFRNIPVLIHKIDFENDISIRHGIWFFFINYEYLVFMSHRCWLNFILKI